MSEPGSPIDPILKPKVATNLERCKKAIAVLDDMLATNPRLESPELMRRVLDVYKKCRFIDRLMNTTFFHEDNFMGLIERVRRNSTVTTADRVQDHKNRLFNESSSSSSAKIHQSSRDNNIFFPSSSSTQSQNHHHLKRSGTLNSSRAKRSNLTPQIYPDINIDDADCGGGCDTFTTNNSSDSLFGCIMTTIDQQQNNSKINAPSTQTTTATIDDCVLSVDIAAAAACQPGTDSGKLLCSPLANNDSGNHTKTNSEWGEASGYTSSDNITTDINSISLLKPNQHPHPNDADQTTSNSCCSIEMIPIEDLSEFAGARLIGLIKAQLLKALQEISQRFISNVQSANSLVSESLGTVKTDKSDGLLTEFDDDDGGGGGGGCVTNDNAIVNEFSNDDNELMMSSTIIDETTAADAVPLDCFLFMEKAPATHQFCLSIFEPTNAQQYFKAVRFDHKLLKTALPPGVWVRYV